MSIPSSALVKSVKSFQNFNVDCSSIYRGEAENSGMLQFLFETIPYKRDEGKNVSRVSCFLEVWQSLLTVDEVMRGSFIKEKVSP